MKSPFIIILLFLTSLLVFSQNKITFGVKAGANLSGFHTANGTDSNYIGLNLGGVAKMKLNKTFGLQSELTFNNKGGNYNFPNTLEYIAIKLNYINLPILLKTQITRKFNFEIGPEFGYLISKKAKLNGINSIEINNTSSFDTNIIGGLSYEFEKGIFIQARYSYGLTNLFDERDYKNSSTSLSLGYFFN